MACPWKLWVVTLSVISVALLLFVIKLIFDKASRDLVKAEAMEYLDTVEETMKLEFIKDSEAAWKRQLAIVSQGDDAGDEDAAEIKFREMQTRQEQAEFLYQLKLNVSQKLPAWKTLNATSPLGQKIRTILGIENTFLMSKVKVKTLKTIETEIQKVQEEERFKMAIRSTGTPSLYPLPKFVTQCFRAKILSSSEWATYYNSIGFRIKQTQYSDYMKLLTEESNLNKAPNPNDLSIQLTFDLPGSEFSRALTHVWTQLEPLYKEFHAYLRGDLRFRWPLEGISKNGTIPAHIFETPAELRGSCNVLYASTKPYPDTSDRNLTHELRRRRYSPRAMATFADDFMSSLGFQILPAAFWSESILRRPASMLTFNCTPKLFLLENEKREFRIRLCGDSDERSLNDVNRLLIQGSLNAVVANESLLMRHFGNLPLRAGIEDGLLLTMRSEPYLRRLGVVDDYNDHLPPFLNALYRELFELFPRITRGLVYYHWSSDILHNKIKPDNYSHHYWDLRLLYEGVAPKEPRGSNLTFDPAVHPNLLRTAAQNTQPLIHALLKYATFESLCNVALESIRNETGANRNRTGEQLKPTLQNCDLFGRTAVGEKLVTLFRTATLFSPTKTFEILFEQSPRNSTLLNASGMLNYFQPLFNYFKETNKRREIPVGW